MIPGLDALIASAPDVPDPFLDTECPFPISSVLFGGAPDIRRLREEAARLQAEEAPPQEAAWAVLVAAEAVESVQADRDRYFVADGAFRGMVFGGIKWRAGWALLMGDAQEKYARAFDAANFLVYTTRPGIAEGRFLGERDTSAVYFGQLLARYALVYSDVQPGERHELTHFVEDHGPGVLVVTGEMRPVEGMLCLALMRLGMRALVASAFPWEIGDRTEVSSPAEALAAAGTFENLRIRSQDPLHALPEYANPGFAHEKFEARATIGGDAGSFFHLRRGVAQEGSAAVDDLAGGIGILVTVDDEAVDAIAAGELEAEAARCLDLLSGVRVSSREPLTLSLREEGAVTAEQMAEVIRRGLRLEYPRLGPVHVQVMGEVAELVARAAEVGREKAQREAEAADLASREPEVVYTCEACAPFSREHICITHPVRAPMCGRSWREMLIGARFMSVSSGRPWRRRGRPENCCAAVPLGRVLDPLKGEYEGLNDFVREATGGRMQRVYLHSIRDFPHSSCGCFYALAWWSEELGGLGLMHRGFEGTAPDGSTWNHLANRAGGKQQPGITGVSLQYLRAPTFLQGDGGWRAVRWMTAKLKEELRDVVTEVAAVPTECAD